MPTPPTGPLARLLELLDLELIEVDLFRATSPQDGRDRIFGGQVLAQGLVAALRTVEGRSAHSLHAYFLRPGDPAVPILFDVDRIRDGRSFTTRRVRAVQRGEAIFNMSVSFQREELGPERQIDLEQPLEPGGLLYEEEMRETARRRGVEIERDDRRFDLPIEMRNVGGLRLFDEAPLSPVIHTWIRARGQLPDDPALHQAVLAYASDFTLMSTALRPLRGAMGPRARTASLDHVMWFHRPFRADAWLLHVQESPVTARTRGLGRGTVYTERGEIVASTAQEGLIRVGRDG